jgi:putative DNA methylase
VSDDALHELCLPMLPAKTYRELTSNAKRAEEIFDAVHTHIWDRVNAHLGTQAFNYPHLVEQLGIMRFGHRPKVGDTFSGSGQIPFEASRLGCDVYASDLNPIACMLTWSAFNIVGASPEKCKDIEAEQRNVIAEAKNEIDNLGIESDGKGWRGKVYLYCLEVKCPSSGWSVPVLPSLVVSKGKKVIAILIPDPVKKRFEIVLESNVSDARLQAAEVGTISRNSRFGEAYVTHTVDGVVHRNSISSIRGDYAEKIDGQKASKNRIRRWTKSDIVFRPDDMLNERLYAIQWIKDDDSIRPETEFRSVTDDDLVRENIVTEYVQKNLENWQENGWVPDMRIELGAPPRYEGRNPLTTRGWTHWHHLFNPRQLFVHCLLNKRKTAYTTPFIASAFENSSRLCRWNPGIGNDKVEQVFSNQSLNTIFNYGARGISFLSNKVEQSFSNIPLSSETTVLNKSSAKFEHSSHSRQKYGSPLSGLSLDWKGVEWETMCKATSTILQ